jgi:surfeit locus 1 family protein
MPLTGATVDPAEADLRRAVVRGAFDFGQEVILRSQSYNGAPGVHLITPLRIAGSDAAVLVDRGWVPLEQSDPGARLAFAGPTGEVEIRGIARQAQTRQSTLTPDDPNPAGPGDRADAWFRVNIDRIQRQVPYRLLPVFLQQGEPYASGNPPASAGRLPIPDIQIDLSNGPHLAYAIQWFSFAAILSGGYVLLYRRRALDDAAPQDAASGENV